MPTPESKTAINLLREQIQFAYTSLEETAKDVTVEIATNKPKGLARSIGSYYAHILIVEDLAVNGLLKKQAPLFAAAWSERTGFDGPASTDPAQWPAWASQAQSDVVSSRAYGQAVYASTVAYLDSLTDADLTKPVDLSAIGLGEQNIGWVLSVFVLTNCNWHTGEISCLKGDHGLKGYPL